MPATHSRLETAWVRCLDRIIQVVADHATGRLCSREAELDLGQPQRFVRLRARVLEVKQGHAGNTGGARGD